MAEELWDHSGKEIHLWRDEKIYLLKQRLEKLLQCDVEAIGTNRVKLGISDNTKRRLRAVQAGSPFPLALWGYCGGCLHQEKQLHIYFAPVQIPGAGSEWFFRCAAIRNLIAHIRDTHRLPPRACWESLLGMPIP